MTTIFVTPDITTRN